jgi:hypothetical protein
LGSIGQVPDKTLSADEVGDAETGDEAVDAKLVGSDGGAGAPGGGACEGGRGRDGRNGPVVRDAETAGYGETVACNRDVVKADGAPPVRGAFKAEEDEEDEGIRGDVIDTDNEAS